MSEERMVATGDYKSIHYHTVNNIIISSSGTYQRQQRRVAEGTDELDHVCVHHISTDVRVKLDKSCNIQLGLRVLYVYMHIFVI